MNINVEKAKKDNGIHRLSSTVIRLPYPTKLFVKKRTKPRSCENICNTMKANATIVASSCSTVFNFLLLVETIS